MIQSLLLAYALLFAAPGDLFAHFPRQATSLQWSTVTASDTLASSTAPNKNPSTTPSTEWARYKSADFVVPPPPAAGSLAEAEDFRLLHAYETTRTPAECALARRQMHPTFESFFGRDWGMLSSAEVALAEPITEKAMRIAERIADYHKAKHQRPRPYDADPTLTPCGVKPGGAKSYPSSHASAAAAGACVLAMVFPDQANLILSYGDSLGKLRAVVGVHHPSDVSAGLSLGRELCQRLHEDLGFQAELKEILGRLP